MHLDGYDQTDLLTGKGPSKRHEIFYFAESTLGAVRIDDYKYRFIDQPDGWLGGTVKVDWPILVNLRLDPFERTGCRTARTGSLAFYNWFAYEFWRFVFVQQEVGEVRPDLHRVPADAEGRELQPRGPEGGAREEDGGSEGRAAAQLAPAVAATRRAPRKGRPFCLPGRQPCGFEIGAGCCILHR